MEKDLLEKLTDEFAQELQDDKLLNDILKKHKSRAAKQNIKCLWCDFSLAKVLSDDYTIDALDFYSLVKMFINSIISCKYFQNGDSKKTEEWKRMINAELLIYLNSLFGLKSLGIDLDMPYELSSPNFLVRDFISLSLVNELDHLNGVVLSDLLINNSEDNIKISNNISSKSDIILLTDEEYKYLDKTRTLSFRKDLYNNWFKLKYDKIGYYSSVLAYERNSKTHHSNLSVEKIDYETMVKILTSTLAFRVDTNEDIYRKRKSMKENKIWAVGSLLYLHILYKELMNLSYEKVEQFIERKIQH